MLVGMSIGERKVAVKQTLTGLKRLRRALALAQRRAARSGLQRHAGPASATAPSTKARSYFSRRSPVPSKRSTASRPKTSWVRPSRTASPTRTTTCCFSRTQTAWGGDTNNRVLGHNVATGKTTELFEASPDADGLGKGLVYSGITCAPGCSDTCLLADANQGVLQRVSIRGGELEVLEPVTVETKVGLPPTGIGASLSTVRESKLARSLRRRGARPGFPRRRLAS